MDLFYLMLDLLWDYILIFLCLGLGLAFTFATKFSQVRLIKEMFVETFKGGDSSKGVSPFQAFSMAIGGRVGLGTIAGVASAIYFGGPGALFWIWVMSFVGAATVFAESTLAQTYKDKVAGEYRGGPSQYLGKGTDQRWIGGVYAIFCFISTAITGVALQSFNIADTIDNAVSFDLPHWVVGVAVAILFSLVVFGGLKRIGKFAQITTPIFTVGYILLAVAILGYNFAEIPATFKLIFLTAFNMEAAFSGIFISAILYGVRRSVYATEAGMGTGAIAAAAAETSHPVKQGLVQALSVYITTIIASATALMILVSGTYNVSDGGDGTVVNNVPDIGYGSGFVQAAADNMMVGLGSVFLPIAVFMFAFTTIIALGFYSDTAISYFFGQHEKIKLFQKIGYGVAAIFIVLGTLMTVDFVWDIEDTAVGLMVLVNLLAMVFLIPKVIKVYNDYEKQRKAGKDPIFRPSRIGLKNAELWEEIADSYEQPKKR